MADEISQVVEMEYKGVYYLFKGSKAMIALMEKAIKALTDRHHTKYLDKPGNCDWKKMQEISKGVPPILEFPKEMFEEKVIRIESDGTKIMKSDFDLYCEKYNLRYCIMPDLNPNDAYIPVAVPAQDVGIHKEQIKAVMERRISGEEDKDKVLDAKAIEEAVAKAGCTVDEIDHFILHQANYRIIESVAKRLKQPMEKFPTNLQEYGNISAASVPILLDNVNNHGIIKKGDKIILAGFGAGLTWGAAMLVW